MGKFGVDKVRLLDFTHNRGKGGAVRMVSVILKNLSKAVETPPELRNRYFLYLSQLF